MKFHPMDFYIFFTPLHEIFTLFLHETEVEFIYAKEVALNNWVSLRMNFGNTEKD
jgi:hypothetical protein